MNDQPALSPDISEEVRVAFGRVLHGMEMADQTYFTMSLGRLCWLLGLPYQERKFVQDAAASPSDFPTLEVFADWLEEEGRPEAERLRRLTPQTGDVLVWSYPWGSEAGLSAVIDHAREIKKRLLEMSRDVVIAMSPKDPETGQVNGPTLLSIKDGDILVWEFDLGNEEVHNTVLTSARMLEEQLLHSGKATMFVMGPRGMTSEIRTDASLECLVNIIATMSEEDRASVLEQFCQTCHCYIGDGIGRFQRNYCDTCSHDPGE